MQEGVIHVIRMYDNIKISLIVTALLHIMRENYSPGIMKILGKSFCTYCERLFKFIFAINSYKIIKLLIVCCT
jgi:hypothetical protein